MRIPSTQAPRVRPPAPLQDDTAILITLIQGIRSSRAVAFAMGEGGISHAALSGALGSHLVALTANTLGQGAADAVRGALEHTPTLEDIEAARSMLTTLHKRRHTRPPAEQQG